MEANIYDVKSWTKSYFGSGTRVSQLVPYYPAALGKKHGNTWRTGRDGSVLM